MPTAEQASAAAWLQQAIAEHESALPEKETQPLLDAWEKTRSATLPEPPGNGLLAHYAFNGNLADSSGNHQEGRLVQGATPFITGPVSPAASFNGEAHIEFPSFHSDRFALAFWMRSAAMPEMTVLTGGPGIAIGVEESHPQPNFKRGSPLYVEFQGRRWHSDRIVFGVQWHHIVLNFENGTPSLLLDGALCAMAPVGQAATTPAGPLAVDDPHSGKPFKGDLGDLRIYDRLLIPSEGETLARYQPIRFMLALDEGKRSKEHKQRLLDYFLSYDAPEAMRSAYRELNSLKERLAELRREIPTVQVMAEMARPRQTFVLGRGDYRNQGEVVTPAVPALLPPLPKDAPANRLGLAEWLFSPQHPLTARVAVNRYWQLFFGIGLVKTTEDFGSQGDEPIYRDLLDYLACEFRKNWDIKAIQRLILTSATYRQQSRSESGTGGKGSREPAAGARPAFPPARRNGARQRARGQPSDQ